MAIDIIPDKLVEDVLESVGEKLDEKLGTQKWVKPLYWVMIVVVLSIPVIYYYY